MPCAEANNPNLLAEEGAAGFPNRKHYSPLTAAKIRESLKSTPEGEAFVLFLRAQNALLFLERCSGDRVFVCAWDVQATSKAALEGGTELSAGFLAPPENKASERSTSESSGAPVAGQVVPPGQAGAPAPPGGPTAAVPAVAVPRHASNHLYQQIPRTIANHPVRVSVAELVSVREMEEVESDVGEEEPGFDLFDPTWDKKLQWVDGMLKRQLDKKKQRRKQEDEARLRGMKKKKKSAGVSGADDVDAEMFGLSDDEGVLGLEGWGWSDSDDDDYFGGGSGGGRGDKRRDDNEPPPLEEIKDEFEASVAVGGYVPLERVLTASFSELLFDLFWNPSRFSTPRRWSGSNHGQTESDVTRGEMVCQYLMALLGGELVHDLGPAVAAVNAYKSNWNRMGNDKNDPSSSSATTLAGGEQGGPGVEPRLGSSSGSSSATTVDVVRGVVGRAGAVPPTTTPSPTTLLQTTFLEDGIEYTKSAPTKGLDGEWTKTAVARLPDSQTIKIAARGLRKKIRDTAHLDFSQRVPQTDDDAKFIDPIRHPWRRSPVWLALKQAMHLFSVRRTASEILYKIFMLAVQSYALEKTVSQVKRELCLLEQPPQRDEDLLSFPWKNFFLTSVEDECVPKSVFAAVKEESQEEYRGFFSRKWDGGPSRNERARAAKAVEKVGLEDEEEAEPKSKKKKKKKGGADDYFSFFRFIDKQKEEEAEEQKKLEQ